MQHIKTYIDEIMGGIVDRCKCTMTQRVLGDGCQYCNPGLADEMWAESLAMVRHDEREDIQYGLNPDRGMKCVWDGNNPGDWDMLAEYFTHE